MRAPFARALWLAAGLALATSSPVQAASIQQPYGYGENGPTWVPASREGIDLDPTAQAGGGQGIAGTGVNQNKDPYSKDIGGNGTPASGDLNYSAQGDATKCCSGGSVQYVQPVQPNFGSQVPFNGAGTAVSNCFDLRDNFPIETDSTGATGLCKWKSRELKTSYCTCGSFTYFDTKYTSIPSLASTDSYDVAQDQACRGYDYCTPSCDEFGQCSTVCGCSY